jgi:hypothetical protein
MGPASDRMAPRQSAAEVLMRETRPDEPGREALDLLYSLKHLMAE